MIGPITPISLAMMLILSSAHPPLVKMAPPMAKMVPELFQIEGKKVLI